MNLAAALPVPEAFTGEAAIVLLTLLLAVTGRELRLARLRGTLNRALHEVRRPLQALALEAPGVSVRQAIQAVGQLDRTLNGVEAPPAPVERIACRLMVDSCIRRWQSRAHLAAAGIELSWTGPDVLVRGDGTALCGAVENLILNAIEHGGPEIRVEGLIVGRWVRIEVHDSGVASRPSGREESPAEVIARQRGSSLHGHGLEIARRTVEEHGGKLELNFARDGSTAAIALPCRRSGRAGGSIRVNW